MESSVEVADAVTWATGLCRNAHVPVCVRKIGAVVFALCDCHGGRAGERKREEGETHS